MGWRDRLQAASFRGVAFEYRSDDLSGIGRRNQVNEYPKRDQGYVEDMGRGTERIDIEAILIGKDYLSQLDDLLKALRAAGPGELVHPFYGRLQVVVDANGRVRHSFEDGGMCAVSMSFVEAGENKYPRGQEIPSIKVLGLADNLQAVATTRFADMFKVLGLPEWVSTAALSDIERIVGSVQTIYRRAENAQWVDLLGNPAGLAGRLLGLFSASSSSFSSGGASLVSDYSGSATSSSAVAVGSTGRLGGLQLAQLFSAPPRAVTTVVPSSAAQAQVQANSVALQDLLTHGAIAQASRDIVAVDDPVYDDLQEQRSALTTVVDREVERENLPQASFDGLADMRAGVNRYVLAESATASRLTTYTPGTTLPAVVLAYDLYEDADRSDELVRRNGLRHPGFVPPEPLKVLTT